MCTTTPTFRLAAHLLTVACTLMSSHFACATEPPPPAPIRPVTDTYYGTEVTDNYRFLENLDDPGVQAWMKSQAEFTDTLLASLPGRQPLLKRIHELLNADLTRGSFVRRGQRYFYETFEPGAALPKLHYRDGLKGTEHLLLDPAKLGKGTNTHYALDFYMPSWDGRLVAVGISAGGSEDSAIHVIDVKSGKTLGESIDRASNSVITWRADNQSFFYLRYAKLTPGISADETLYNGRTYLHTMGVRVTGDGDPVIFGRGVDPSVDVPDGQGTFIVLSPDATYALAVASHNMDQNPSTLFATSLAQATGSHTPWRQIAAVDDGVTQFQVQGDKLYFLTLKGAPRFSLKVTSLAQPDIAHADVLVPEGPAVIDGFALAREGIYVQERDGAGSRLLLASYDGKQSRVVALPFDGRLDTPVTDPRESGTLYNLQGWIEPSRMFAYDAATDQSSDSGLIPPTHLDLSQAESKEVFAVGQDGTRIPLSIVYQKGLKLDGTHPTMLTGYGSYGLSFDPNWFPAALSLSWIERGGVVAIAHVRGGGEYGESWHRAGQKSTKLNTISDFIACGDYLVKQHYTSPKLLAAWSASAGGITVGGALTWRPDLFGVIIDQVGMTDTLRFETTPNGPPNVSEFGSVKTEDGFHDLYKGAIGKVAPNLLERNFGASKPNQKWVTDVTEFNIKGEKVYLSPILDLYNQEIVSYEIADRPQISSVMQMLQSAFKQLGPKDKPMIHSDQGWQYQMGLYQQALHKQGVTQSMSRKGNCLDNAVMENWFGIMKTEFFYRRRFESIESFKTELKEYIHYYNHDRIKQKLKGLSPVNYRTQSLVLT